MLLLYKARIGGGFISTGKSQLFIFRSSPVAKQQKGGTQQESRTCFPQMATFSIAPQKKHYSSIRKISLLLLLFLIILLLINNENLRPQLSLYRDLSSSSSRSPKIPASSNSGIDDNSANLFQETGLITSVDEPISSKSDLDDKTSETNSASFERSTVTDTNLTSFQTSTSSNSDFEEKNDGNEALAEGKETSFEEPTSSESGNADESNNPTSSKSDFENDGNEALVDSKDTSFEEPISSESGNADESNDPTSSKSDFDDKNNGNEASIDSKETSFEDPISSESGNVDGSGSKDLALWKSCDFYQGKWVEDEGYPIYRPGSCPYVDEAFDCQSNGRPDSEYLKWRWQPDGCDLPRFNATDFLVRLRGKRLMLVGDSMNRNQFESLLCLLREGLHNKSKMYEVHGHKITKGRGYYMFKFEEYNCTVEFVRSHFLVREGIRINAQGNSNPTLSIDRIDKSAGRWQRADILVFNTAHWWTHGKTSRGKNYYKEGNYIYPKFDATEAYRRALKTWSKWVDNNTKRGRLIFYRGYSSAHFRGGDWDSGGTCMRETEPVQSGSILDSYPLKMRIVEEVIKDMQVPVVLLNVTRLTNYRKDGHPSVYGKKLAAGQRVSAKRQDCSHWCLPGVPDAWNELIYATLVVQPSPFKGP